ncbi:monovalent cation/H+ antiporter complex subunit F [Nocardioides dongxiaopingii]|uniref:monovalent cation/H+ antiporter complex subunit F n=1 Tax=Nocardioides sp. S-1144 TaxID=2582905 RepID=UPI001C9E5909|nr:monovalent cation/H+ antiporter complex subunit F [Nocardioides sp. S-1144]
MTALLVVAAVVLGIAAVLVVVRMAIGPTMLDRAIAFDVIVAISIAAVSLDAAHRRTAENLPLLLVATLLGFVGSVSIARFSPGSDDVEESDDDSDDQTDQTDQSTDRSAGEAR